MNIIPQPVNSHDTLSDDMFLIQSAIRFARQLATLSIIRGNAHYEQARRLVHQSRLSISVEVERVCQREQFDVLEGFTAAQTLRPDGVCLVPVVRYCKYTELLNEIPRVSDWSHRVTSCGSSRRVKIAARRLLRAPFSFFLLGNELLTIHGRRTQVTGRNWPKNLKSVGCRDRSAET